MEIKEKEKEMNTNEMYESPQVEVIEVEVENGFAASTERYEEYPW